MKARNSFLLLGLAFLMACGGPNLNEEIIDTNPDGTPKRVQYFKGEGETKVLKKDVHFYEDGKERVEGEYADNGKKDGEWNYWYENGNKWSEGEFKDGLNHGKRTTWHENGELNYEGAYDMGKRIGVWKFYNDKGELIKEIDYDEAAE